MADDEFTIEIEKYHWRPAVTRSVQPELRKLADKHGLNMAAAQQARGQILIKGDPAAVKKAKPELIAMLKEHFPDADLDLETEAPAPAPAAPSPKTSPKSAPAKAPKAAAPAPVKKKEKKEPKPTIFKEPTLLPMPNLTVNKDWKDPERMVAPDLIWQCIRGGNSFLRTSPVGIKGRMSSEPGNLTGQHSFKYSGIANTEPVGIQCEKNGKKENIMLTKGRYKVEHQSKPEALTFKTGISKCPKRGLSALDNLLGAKLYRQDLLGDAKEKYLKVKQSLKKKKKSVSSRRKPASA
eukprot:gnl/MRDRNA2_/MRDRNA2_121686_c0_seq1.p1 gnl/MRDRNA2_/MRDRNA2_121686_c0~~gnl/MRDRNA2_/MRDRNA2_121686_c0_seq1.p1  ORF type:complete len:294 (-),score=80.34 gnl/MRDRNA2_/MRDRNA2_121686_c0_seq1:32-913(-)